MIHIGPYSVPAYDSVDSAKRRLIQNGSEWYQKRLLTKSSDYRPTSGWQETQSFHRQQYGETKDYRQFANQLDTEKWDVDAWVDACVSISGSYLVLTAKHHDGYCLWPTKTTSFCSARRNVLIDCRDAARRRGLLFGIYYSWMEFTRSMTKEYVDTVMVPQVKELIALAPDLFWFDGDWTCSTQYAQQAIDSCVSLIRRTLPRCQVNDRIGYRDERKNPDFLGPCSYRVYQDRAIPSVRPNVPWEHVNTIGHSWGYNRTQKLSDYKSGSALLSLLTQVKSLGGRFLLNVGPRADGTLCPEEGTRLKELRLALQHRS